MNWCRISTRCLAGCICSDEVTHCYILQVLRVWPDGRLEEHEGLPEEEVIGRCTWIFFRIQLEHPVLSTCIKGNIVNWILHAKFNPEVQEAEGRTWLILWIHEIVSFPQKPSETSKWNEALFWDNRSKFLRFFSILSLMFLPWQWQEDKSKWLVRVLRNPFPYLLTPQD